MGLCPTVQKPSDRVTGIVLEVEDVKKFYETFQDTIPFKSEPQEKVHGIMVSMQDPGGNIIDLYQPTPERVQNLVKEVVDRDQKECKNACNKATCQCRNSKADA